MKDENLTPRQLWRKHRLRQVMLFVTIPGVLLGTASITAAYSAGWMTPPTPKPACTPVVCPHPPAPRSPATAWPQFIARHC